MLSTSFKENNKKPLLQFAGGDKVRVLSLPRGESYHGLQHEKRTTDPHPISFVQPVAKISGLPPPSWRAQHLGLRKHKFRVAPSFYSAKSVSRTVVAFRKRQERAVNPGLVHSTRRRRY